MANADARISLYSLADLKNTSDDAIPNYLNSLKFKQSHILADVRLALGYLAFVICAATFCWDYKFGFDNTKYYTAAAVAVYTCLNGLLTFWIWGVEKGKVYVGTSPNGDKIEVSSLTKKHVPIYNLTITYYTAKRPATPNTISLARPFSQWFDAEGHFVPRPFQQMFASEVPVIGKVDPSRVVQKADGKVAQALPEAVPHQTPDDIFAAASSSGAGPNSAAATSRKAGSKNRKKA